MVFTVTEIVQRAPSELTVLNPGLRLHSEKQISALRKSLHEFGFVAPLVIDTNGFVLDGAAILIAAGLEGFSAVPCVVAEHLSPEQCRAFRLAVNRLSELAEWDAQAVSVELCELRDAGYDIELTGFSSQDILIEAVEPAEDDFDPAPAVTPRCSVGELWALGRHRLYVGDCTDRAGIDRLFDDVPASLLLTDPPYGVSYVSDNGKTIKNDKLRDDALRSLLEMSFNIALSHLERGCSFYIWHSDGQQGLTFREACANVGMLVRQTLVWVKPQATLTHSDYHWRHEPCLVGEALPKPSEHEAALYGWKTGGKHLWCADRKQTTVVEFPKPLKSDEHPTMKPVKLFGYCIGNSTVPGAIVYDPFAGSGTTVIACEELNRAAYCCELDPQYADVIIRRWEAYAGKEAVLIG